MNEVLKKISKEKKQKHLKKKTKDKVVLRVQVTIDTTSEESYEFQIKRIINYIENEPTAKVINKNL